MIKKYSGETEPFSEKKFMRSLEKAGAEKRYIQEIADEIKEKKDITSTHDVYEYAFNRLKDISPALAAKYNLKKAIMALGPTGFAFEKFLAHLYQEQGYHIQTDRYIQGVCASHELDVVATKNNETIMIEAKFHSEHGAKNDIKVTLYVKARFDDIKNYYKQQHKEVTGILISNTKFTTEALNYAECAHLNLIGWGYPIGNGLPERIEKLHLIPITALTMLSDKQKRALIEKGCVLCRDVKHHIQELRNLRLSEYEIKETLEEAEGVCLI